MPFCFCLGYKGHFQQVANITCSENFLPELDIFKLSNTGKFHCKAVRKLTNRISNKNYLIFTVHKEQMQYIRLKMSKHNTRFKGRISEVLGSWTTAKIPFLEKEKYSDKFSN